MFTQAWCKLWRPAPREWCLRQISGEEAKWKAKKSFVSILYLLTWGSWKKNVCFSLIPQNVWFVLTTDAIRMSCHCVNLRLMKAALDSELLVLLHGPKNRRPKWTQMISRCLFRQQGFGAGASCPMQMIITSVLWHLRQQHRRLIHVRHFIMWAWGILHFPNLWHATQAMAKDACDHRKPAIFLMPRPTRWHDLRVC